MKKKVAFTEPSDGLMRAMVILPIRPASFLLALIANRRVDP